MNYFELGFSKIMRLINECIETMWPDTLVYAGIGFAIGLIFLVVLKKTGMLRRNTRFGKFMVIIWWIYLPFVASTTCFTYSSAEHTKEYLIKQIPSNITPMIKLTFPTFQFLVHTKWEKIIAQGKGFNQVIDEYTSTIHFNNESRDYKVYIANIMVPKTARWGFEAVVEVNRLSDDSKRGRLSDLLLVRKLNIYNIPVDFWQRIEGVMERKLTAYFDSIYQILWTTISLAFLLPILEIFCASLARRIRSKV